MRKTILILGAGIEHQIAIKLAKNLGYKVIVVDVDPKAPGLTLIKWLRLEKSIKLTVSLFTQ